MEIQEAIEKLSTSLGHVAENNGMSGLQLEAFILTIKDSVIPVLSLVAEDAFKKGVLTGSFKAWITFEDYWKSVTDNLNK